MGLFKKVSTCQHDACNETSVKSNKRIVQGDNNPDPYNFSIQKYLSIGRFVIAKINYPNCTNYEGNKILIFENLDVKTLLKQHHIDPHFCNTGCTSPIARFKPTDDGWNMAVIFCNAAK
jgi:hypothetical protein